MSAGAVDRTLTFLEAETLGVKGDPGFDIARSTLQKSRLLAELQRVPAAQVDHDAALALRAAIAVNTAELAAQLGAVRQINALIVETMRADLSDGTYGLPGR